MSRLPMILLAIIAAAGLLAGAVLGFDALLDWRAGRAFAHIEKGFDGGRVHLFLGNASRQAPCGDTLWWGDTDAGKNDGSCARWDYYDYRKGSWAIGYSADGKVVAKHRFPASP
jgi:hypothetical protein